MVPLNVPGPVTLVGSAITEIDGPPVVPLEDDTLSQLPPDVVLGVAVNVSEMLGEVVTERLCDSNEVEFTELKVNEVGEGTNVTDSGATVRVTVTNGVVALALQPEAVELEADVNTQT